VATTPDGPEEVPARSERFRPEESRIGCSNVTDLVALLEAEEKATERAA
jgi:hypothetical protein